jgi:hypothetical protein
VKYLQKAREMMANFTTCEVFYVPRSQNKKFDALSKLASVSFSHLAKEIRVEVLQSLATESMEDCTVKFNRTHGWNLCTLIYQLDTSRITEKRLDKFRLRLSNTRSKTESSTRDLS